MSTTSWLMTFDAEIDDGDDDDCGQMSPGTFTLD